MLRLSFTSDPFLYRLPGDIPVTGFPTATYYDYLVTPPRIYGEEYDGGGVIALFLNQETSVDGYEVIYLWLQQNQRWWPSYNFTLHRWNATTGAYLGRADAGFSPYLSILAQSRDGTLWALYSFSGLNAYKVNIDPTTHAIVFDATPTYNFSGFSGLIQLLAFSIDVEQNLLLANVNNAPQLVVYNLTTGAVIRTIQLPGLPTQIMPEDTGRCYVAVASSSDSTRRVCLVNYVTGQLLSVFQVQTAFDPFSPQRAITWDRKYRRFLTWTYAPVTTEGQNTSVIKGYFPVPQPVTLTAPVPLRPPRKYRSTPILTRVCGDMGESMPGARVTLTPGSGIATVSGFPSLTDSDGEGVGTIYDADAGSLTLSASTTV